MSVTFGTPAQASANNTAPTVSLSGLTPGQPVILIISNDATGGTLFYPTGIHDTNGMTWTEIVAGVDAGFTRSIVAFIGTGGLGATSTTISATFATHALWEMSAQACMGASIAPGLGAIDVLGSNSGTSAIAVASSLTPGASGEGSVAACRAGTTVINGVRGGWTTHLDANTAISTYPSPTVTDAEQWDLSGSSTWVAVALIVKADIVTLPSANVALGMKMSGTETLTNIPVVGGVALTLTETISTGLGYAPTAQVPWMLPVAINDHPYMMDFSKTRITTMQIRRVSADDSVEPGEQCVDEETEILTQRGWLLHQDLRIGDQTLTLNMGTGLSEWQPVEDVRRYERHDFQMFSMEGRGHSSLTTLNHRWPVSRHIDHGNGGKERVITIRTSEQLNTKDSLFAATECATLPVEPKYTDELVELVAWFYTEGNVTWDHRGERVRRVTIAQHPRVNPEKCDRIRACLIRALGPEHRGIWYEYQNPSNGVTLFHLQRGTFDEILDAAPGKDKVVRPEWIASLTRAQLDLFIDVTIQGDGWDQGNWIALSQASRERIDSFQMACVLAGYRANRIYEVAPMSAAGWRWKVSASKIRRQFSPIAAARKQRHARTSTREMNKSAMEIKTVTYDGVVWCPKTENETWCARRDGAVYFTGNTLSASGVWPRAQDNYFLGAGQKFLDNRFAFESVYVHSGEYPSVRTRFWKSQGVNPWAEGELTLQPEYESIATSTANLVIVVCGNYLYRSDGIHLWWTLSPVGVASPTWTEVTSANTHNIVSITSDGSRVWFACGADGVYVTVAGTTTSATAATPVGLNGVGGLSVYAAGAGTTNTTNMPNSSTIWHVSEVDAFGNETAAVSVTAMPASTPMNLTWNPDTNATNFNVYRGANLVYTGDTPSFVDDGTVAGTAQAYPTSNGTGVTPYKATWILYAKGHLVASTGRDLVEILASQNITFIFQHENPGFVFTCGCECPSAILVGGYAGSQSFVGAIQPDSSNNGATLAPPTWATTMTPGEQINDIQYDAGAILMATSLGIRSGTKPDSTGTFDVNPVIEDPGSVLCVTSWSQYMYFGWSNYAPAEPWAPNRPVVAGLGRADLSQYTTAGVPGYATDVMGQSAGITTAVVVMGGVPYFVVLKSGTYTLYGDDNNVVPSGWMEPGWVRYGTLENKIVVEVDFQHEPLPSGASVQYQIVSEDKATVTNVGTNSVAGSTSVLEPLPAGLMVGDRFMPIVTLTSTANQSAGPVFLSHITKAMVTTKRQDEILLAIILSDEVQSLGPAPQTWYQNCLTEYMYLKSLEQSGEIINLTMGGIVRVAFIDQIMLEPDGVDQYRQWFQGAATVKLISLD